MKRIFCLLAVLFCTFLLLDVSAQGEYATPKSGEGISSFLEPVSYTHLTLPTIYSV